MFLEGPKLLVFKLNSACVFEPPHIAIKFLKTIKILKIGICLHQQLLFAMAFFISDPGKWPLCSEESLAGEQMTPLHLLSKYSLFLKVNIRFIWSPPLKNIGYVTEPGHFLKRISVSK